MQSLREYLLVFGCGLGRYSLGLTLLKKSYEHRTSN
jgi:hypothetical protein